MNNNHRGIKEWNETKICVWFNCCKIILLLQQNKLRKLTSDFKWHSSSKPESVYKNWPKFTTSSQPYQKENIWSSPYLVECDHECPMNALFPSSTAGRCVHSFHVLVINSTCVSLSWSLLHISAVPLFMVVQWFPRKQQDFQDFGLSGKTWAKLSYTEPPTQLRGNPLSEICASRLSLLTDL